MVIAAGAAIIGSFAVPIGGAAPVAEAAGGGFTGVTPARLWDTRSGPGVSTIDGASLGTGAMGADSTYTLQVTGRGNIPASGVGAVALNVTAINPSELSFITVYPSGATRPKASNLNLIPGQTLPNMAIVPVSSGGKVDVYNLAGTTDVAIDVLGWFAPQGFTAINPERMLDTRKGPGIATIDGRYEGEGPLGPDDTEFLQIAGRGSVPEGPAAAVVLNVTAVNPSAPSFITVHPGGANRPTASNLNLAPGRTVPNLVIVKLFDPGGFVTPNTVDIYNAAGTTDVIVDVLGWFPKSGAIAPIAPARLWDTRSGTGVTTVDGQQQGTGRLGTGQVGTVQVTGRGDVPSSGVAAVALNVAAIDPDAPSFLTVYPSGQPRPEASNLNLAPGRTLPNAVIVPVSADGKIDVFNAAGSTDVVVDVLGWFGSTPGAAGGSGRLYYSSLIGIDYTDLKLLREFTGQEAIEADTDFTVNAAATEFVYGIRNFPTTDIVVADLATGNIKATFDMGGSVARTQLIYPSPDDSLYAATVFDEDDTFGPTNLRIVDRNGALVSAVPRVGAFAWASDGSIVLIVDRSGGGTYELLVVPASGATAYPVATFTQAFDDLPTQIDVAPDRSLIAYADEGNIYTVPFAGGAAPTPVVQSAARLGEPAFSPDSRSLALSRSGDSAGGNCSAIYIVPAVANGAPPYLVGGDNDPFRMILPPQNRISSCGEAMFWR